MREYDALKQYQTQPKPKLKRTIANRIIASYRGHSFFDGQRVNGYGGFRYDGRWKPVAVNFIEEYGLTNESSILQLGCEKGFLLHELLQLNPLMRVRGQETSLYARDQAMRDIRLGIRLHPYVEIPFHFREFDLVIALGIIYTLNLGDAIKCLKEIVRVGKDSFVTLASYETREDLELFKHWSLLGTTILKKEEWLEVLKHCEYEGDYSFVTAQSLGLCALS